MEKECTELCCWVLCLFLVEAWKQTVSVETPKMFMYALCSQHVPIQCNALVRRCISNSALSRTIAAHCKSSTSNWSRTFYRCVHGFSFNRLCWFCTRHNPLFKRWDCPLCRWYFQNIPLQNTLPTIALQHTVLLSFRSRLLCAALHL